MSLQNETTAVGVRTYAVPQRRIPYSGLAIPIIVIFRVCSIACHTNTYMMQTSHRLLRLPPNICTHVHTNIHIVYASIKSYVYIENYMHMHARIPAYTNTHAQTPIYARIHAYTNTHAQTPIYACLSLSFYLSITNMYVGR